jgi:uncharacterized protein (DUF2147 family)
MACVGQTNVFAANEMQNSLWQSIDDVTGKPKAIIRISESASHTLQGTIIKIWPRPGFDQHELCSACKGDLHNKPIVGMTIFSGMQQDSDSTNNWSGGEILDPHNGKTYHCKMELINNQEMNVRGYIGMPLFGRTQTWHRVNDING